MRSFTVTDDYTTIAAAKTVLALASDGTNEAYIHEVMLSSYSAPESQSYRFKVATSTAIAGTSVSQTPFPRDSGKAAAATDGRITYTSTDPTYAAGNHINQSLNQQNGFSWQTLPEMGIVMPATSNFGVGLQIVSVTGGTIDVTGQFVFAE